MRSWIAVCLVVLAGCGGSKLSRSGGSLSVGATELTLPETYVGFPVSASVPLSSSAKASRSAQLSVEGPFTLEAAEVVVGAEETVEVPVHFAASVAGSATGTLSVTTDDGAVQVALSANAKPVPACSSSEPCLASTFDPERGECVLAPLADGSTCQSGTACFASSQCLGGVCVGTARSCDDGNACTTDACDPVSGCVHAPVTCGAVEELCKVAVCDPATGCGVANAVDGTPCGSIDCVTAHVCMTGQCKALAVPDGMECAPVSPCQGKGTCQAQVCVRPPAAPLTPAWTYTPPADATLFFNGLADVLGNLYWVECSASRGCQLLSATPSGFVRFTVSLGGTTPPNPNLSAEGRLLIAGDLVVAAFSGTHLEARRTMDGSLAWSAPLMPLIGVKVAFPPSAVTVSPLVDDGHGGVFLAVNVTMGGAGLNVLGRVDAQTGAVRWSHELGGTVTSAGSDGAGNLFVVANVAPDGGWGTSLQSLDLDGGVRFAVETPQVRKLAVSDGRVALSIAGVALSYSASTGAALSSTTPPASGWLWPDLEDLLLDADETFVLGQVAPISCPIGVPCQQMFPALVLASVSAAQAPAPSDWQLQLNAGVWFGGDVSASAPSRSADGDVVFAQFHTVKTSAAPVIAGQLRAITSHGLERFACELPTSSTGDAMLYDGTALLADGRWVSSAQEECSTCLMNAPRKIFSFDLPGVTPATSGWSTAAGNAQRSARAR
jgi:hypothetical protein